MMKKFLKNGEMLSGKSNCTEDGAISTEDGAVGIAASLGTIQLWKTKPIWKFPIFSLK